MTTLKANNLYLASILRASEIALAVATYNAAMGRIVAAPAGAAAFARPHFA